MLPCTLSFRCLSFGGFCEWMNAIALAMHWAMLYLCLHSKAVCPCSFVPNQTQSFIVIQNFTIFVRKSIQIVDRIYKGYGRKERDDQIRTFLI